MLINFVSVNMLTVNKTKTTKKPKIKAPRRYFCPFFFDKKKHATKEATKSEE